MSINQLLQDQPKPWLDIRVNSILVDDIVQIEGNLGVESLNVENDLIAAGNTEVSSIMVLDTGRVVTSTTIYGDSLCKNPFGFVNDYWPEIYSDLYPGAGDIENNAIAGSTMDDLSTQIYQNDDPAGDTILWIGYNTFQNLTLSNGGLRGYIYSAVAFLEFCMWRPANLRIGSDANVVLAGTWVNTPDPMSRGVQTTSATPGTLTINNINTRYLYVHLLFSDTAATANSITWNIDGSQVYSNKVQIMNLSGTFQYAHGLFIDRGAALIGTNTSFILNSAVTGTGTITTRVIGYVASNTLPTNRATLVGPWHSIGYGSHTLGGPTITAACDTLWRQLVNGYRNIGLDMRYFLPPFPTLGDWYGQDQGTIHPNRQYNEKFARALGKVTLASNSTTKLLMEGSNIPMAPTYFSS